MPDTTSATVTLVSKTALVSRGIGYPGQAAITADVIVEEQHEDDSDISDHPVEYGSTVSDNIIDLPQVVTLIYGWSPASKSNTSKSDTFLRQLYAQFLALKTAKLPLNVYTGKRSYTNMVIKNITTTTDVHNENSLTLRITFRQIIIVYTEYFQLPQDPANVANPQTGLGTVNQGTVQPVPVSSSADLGSFLDES